MKKVFGWMLAAVVLVSASAAFAQCGAVGGDAKAKSAKPPCCVALEKIKLTDDQKPKVTVLQGECKGISCPIATKKKMSEALKGILTDQQYQQWEKTCAATAKGDGCGAKTGSCGAK